MPDLDRRLRMLHSAGPEAAERVLARALPEADPAELGQLAAAMVRLGRRHAIAVVLRCYDSIDADVRQLLHEQPAEIIADAVVRAASAETKNARRQAMRACLEFALPATMHLVVEHLESAEAETAALAARAALAISRRHREASGMTRTQIDRALAPALIGYPEHRHDEILLAAALQLPFPGPRLQSVLSHADDPAVMALRSVVRHAVDETLSDRLIALLAVPAVAGAVRLRLIDTETSADWTSILRQSHLVLAPRIRNELRKCDRPMLSAPSTLTSAELDDAGQAAIPRWLCSLPLTEKMRAARLGDGVTYRAPHARLAALRHLMERGTREADEAITHFCFVDDGATARIATRYTLRRIVDDATPLRATVDHLRRSPHGEVRRLVARRAPRGIEELDTAWQLAVGGRAWAATAIIRRAMRQDAAGVVAAIRRRVRSGPRDERLLAIAMLRELGLTASAELELLAIAAGDDHRVAASAVTALADVDSPAAASTLTACLHHVDDRVVANAVESIDRRLPWHGAVDALARACQPIERLADGRGNRSRANALRTLIRSGCASPSAVAAMLSDEHPLHRVSGLWLVGRLGLTQVQEEVRALASSNQPTPVRERAEIVVRRLTAAQRRTAVPIAAASVARGVSAS
jgi:O-acetyl-ADP-ribose deacetylase (regulator of RNase III)